MSEKAQNVDKASYAESVSLLLDKLATAPFAELEAPEMNVQLHHAYYTMWQLASCRQHRLWLVPGAALLYTQGE